MIHTPGTTLGLVYKDAGEPAKAIAAFQHVEKIAPEEPDAFLFRRLPEFATPTI